jgi:hypothetical protein
MTAFSTFSRMSLVSPRTFKVGVQVCWKWREIPFGRARTRIRYASMSRQGQGQRKRSQYAVHLDDPSLRSALATQSRILCFDPSLVTLTKPRLTSHRDRAVAQSLRQHVFVCAE